MDKRKIWTLIFLAAGFALFVFAGLRVALFSDRSTIEIIRSGQFFNYFIDSLLLVVFGLLSLNAGLFLLWNLEKKKRTAILIFGGEFILLIIAVVLIANIPKYAENRSKQVLSQNAAITAELKTIYDSLDAGKAMLQSLKGKKSDLDSLLAAEERLIDLQKKELSDKDAAGQMTNDEVIRAKEMINHDQAIIAELQEQVQELKLRNQQLTTELNSAKKTTTNLSEENKGLSEQNKGLSKKVELGSLLHLRNIQVQGVSGKRNRKGEDEVVTKVKKSPQIKVSFETGDNKVLEKGEISLYVRIINPKGETISIAQLGSGVIKSGASGSQIQYSKKVDFDWDQTNKKMAVYWEHNVTDVGLYKVEIYQSGYLIGLGVVELK